MGSAAQIIDLAEYRRQRTPVVASSSPAPLPVVFVPVWTYVPVMVVARYF